MLLICHWLSLRLITSRMRRRHRAPDRAHLLPLRLLLGIKRLRRRDVGRLIHATWRGRGCGHRGDVVLLLVLLVVVLLRLLLLVLGLVLGLLYRGRGVRRRGLLLLLGHRSTHRDVVVAAGDVAVKPSGRSVAVKSGRTVPVQGHGVDRKRDDEEHAVNNRNVSIDRSIGEGMAGSLIGSCA